MVNDIPEVDGRGREPGQARRTPQAKARSRRRRWRATTHSRI